MRQPTHASDVLVAFVHRHRVRLETVRRVGDRLVHDSREIAFELSAAAHGEWRGAGWSARLVSGLMVGTLDLFVVPDGARRGRRLYANHKPRRHLLRRRPSGPA